MWNKIKRNIIRTSISFYEKRTRKFVVTLNRPQFATDIKTWSDSFEVPLTAITIQGPLLHEQNFTLETIKLYRRIYPKALIILSTWIGENEIVLKQIEALGATVLRTKKPDYAGPFNMNMQIVSAKAALLKAKELGAKYAIKSRTDQRMYSPHALGFLHSLLQTFPYKASYSKQKQRITTCSKETLIYRPYGVTDQFLFGDMDDMLLYWSCPLDDRPQSTGKNTKTVRDFMHARICEIYFATEFMKVIGRTPLWTLKDSWDFFRDHMIVADDTSLDLYWRKYDHWKTSRFTSYGAQRNDRDMYFRDWLNIYAHPNIKVRENILDLPFHATIPEHESH